MQLEGSKTLDNLKTAFIGESQARNKYNIYSKIARKEGYEQIGDIFDMTAHNERAHAELWLTLMSEGIPENTAKALQNAAGGESLSKSPCNGAANQPQTNKPAGEICFHESLLL